MDVVTVDDLLRVDMSLKLSPLAYDEVYLEHGARLVAGDFAYDEDAAERAIARLIAGMGVTGTELRMNTYPRDRGAMGGFSPLDNYIVIAPGTSRRLAASVLLHEFTHAVHASIDVGSMIVTAFEEITGVGNRKRFRSELVANALYRPIATKLGIFDETYDHFTQWHLRAMVPEYPGWVDGDRGIIADVGNRVAHILDLDVRIV